uniref:Uncharacterized protein n=1 Tax=viral metagenome TaxID=1070528 RepID=A0A6C0KI00_9ZZZZ
MAFSSKKPSALKKSKFNFVPLKPLIMTPIDPRILEIQENLKKMDGDLIQTIYNSPHLPLVKGLKIKNIGMVMRNGQPEKQRHILFVESILTPNKKIPVMSEKFSNGQLFYQSTGTSRELNTSIQDLWFPFEYLGRTKIHKSEDKYLLDDKLIKKDMENKEGNNPLLYMRFINANNTAISKYLQSVVVQPSNNFPIIEPNDPFAHFTSQDELIEYIKNTPSEII